MSQFLQGFVINRNLEENIEDENTFNNLGVSPIADDLSLLRNNKRNVSTLTVTNSNINTTINYIVFVNSEAVFTNRTKLTKANGGGIYYVKNSNGVDRFQLSLDQNLISTVVLNNTFSGVYSRSDEITNENFKNIKTNRRPALETVASEELVEEVPNDIPVDVFSASIISQIKSFEAYADSFNNIKEKTILRNEDFTTDVSFLNIGYLSIDDPDNFNNVNLTATNGPGLFIYNAVTGNKIRAFSDSNNVWAPDLADTYLETSANTITTGSLTISNNSITIQRKPNSTQPLAINATSASAITTTGAGAVFTHKMKIFINGEEFFLCMSNSGTVN